MFVKENLGSFKIYSILKYFRWFVLCWCCFLLTNYLEKSNIWNYRKMLWSMGIPDPWFMWRATGAERTGKGMERELGSYFMWLLCQLSMSQVPLFPILFQYIDKESYTQRVFYDHRFWRHSLIQLFWSDLRDTVLNKTDILPQQAHRAFCFQWICISCSRRTRSKTLRELTGKTTQPFKVGQSNMDNIPPGC